MVKKVRLKKSMKKKLSWIPVSQHGVFYKVSSGFLVGANMLKSGKRETGNIYEIEESPKSYKKVHLKVLKELGKTDTTAKKILKQINYY